MKFQVYIVLVFGCGLGLLIAVSYPMMKSPRFFSIQNYSWFYAHNLEPPFPTMVPPGGVSWNLPPGFTSGNVTSLASYPVRCRLSRLGAAIQKKAPGRENITSKTFLAHPGPVTALASFQGSGNTWSRHLLEQLTGKALIICLEFLAVTG